MTKQRPTRVLVILVLTLLLGTSVRAAFQESIWGARPAGLGGAFSAVADDANAPAYNPAGITWVENNEITFMYAQLYSGLTLYSGEDTSKLGLGYFSYVPNIKEKKYGSYAFSWSNFVASNLYREDTFSLTAADSYQFDQFAGRAVLSYGANLKLLRRSFSTDKRTENDPVFQSGRDSSAMGVDLGLILRPHFTTLPGLKFALTGQNINRPDMGLTGTDRVPEKYTLGVAYQDAKIIYFNPSLDISHRNGENIIAGGVESWLVRDTLALRVGGDADQLGGGFGYQFNMSKKFRMRLDYGLIWPLNVTGTNGSHRVSITASF